MVFFGLEGTCHDTLSDSLAGFAGVIMSTITPPLKEGIIMDATATTTDIVTLDDAGVTETQDSFAKEVGKTVATTAATTAAMVGVIYLTRFASNKYLDIRARRAAKKDEPEVHVVTDLPETTPSES